MNKLSTTKEFSWKSFFLRWEWCVFGLLIIINIINANISPKYLNFNNLITVTRSFLDKSFILFPMTMVLLMGEIDISVASIVALSSSVMAVSYQWAGIPMGIAMVICLIVATFCGFLNGFLLTKFPELPPMIITYFGQLLYRGIAEYMLAGQALSDYPKWFRFFGWNNILGLPVMLWAFVICCVLFYFIIERSTFGRKIYAIGSNRVAAKYAGVDVQKIRWIVFSLNGFMSGITSIFLTSRTTSTRSDMAAGYELDVIAMIVLGGVSSAGGKGHLIGPIISVFIIGLLRYGLGLANVNSQYLISIIGALLIISALISNLIELNAKRKRKLVREAEK